MFQNGVIDRYMHCIVQNKNKNAQLSIYSLADQNIGHCVELTYVTWLKTFEYDQKPKTNKIQYGNQSFKSNIMIKYCVLWMQFLKITNTLQYKIMVYGWILKSNIKIKENKTNIILSRLLSNTYRCCTSSILRLYPVLFISRKPYTVLKDVFI